MIITTHSGLYEDLDNTDYLEPEINILNTNRENGFKFSEANQVF